MWVRYIRVRLGVVLFVRVRSLHSRAPRGSRAYGFAPFPCALSGSFEHVAVQPGGRLVHFWVQAPEGTGRPQRRPEMHRTNPTTPREYENVPNAAKQTLRHPRSTRMDRTHRNEPEDPLVAREWSQNTLTTHKEYGNGVKVPERTRPHQGAWKCTRMNPIWTERTRTTRREYGNAPNASERIRRPP